MLRLVKEKEIVELTRNLVRIPSVTGEEGEIAAFIADFMERAGFEVETYEKERKRPNVVGRLRGERGTPTLIFNGHMDTVPLGDKSLWKVDPYEGKIIDGKMFGRGTTDMKGGLAAMLKVAEILKKTEVNLKGDLVLEAVVDEEAGGFAGTKYLCVDKPIKGDFAIICEPTNLEIKIVHKGDLGVNIFTKGKAAHAAKPELGINAIYKMLNVIEALRNMPKKFHWEKKVHRLVGGPCITVSVMEGGLQRNMVPASCRIVVDRRIVPGLETIDDAKKEIEQIIEELKEKDPELNIEMKPFLEVDGMEISEKEKIVEVLKVTFEQVLHRTPTIAGELGFTDQRFLWNYLKIPPVMFGAGGIECGAHAPNEYVRIDHLIEATKVYMQAAINLLS